MAYLGSVPLPVVVRFINLNYRRCQFSFVVVQQGESSGALHVWLLKKNKESWVKDRPRAGENKLSVCMLVPIWQRACAGTGHEDR